MSITPSGGTVRSFGYDAAGNITTDTGSAGTALSFQFDTEGRLAKTYQTATPANGATYSYDAKSRLSSRTVTQAASPTSTTTVYAYDTNDHIIAELNTSGQTLREYMWLGDMPVAVADNVQSGSPVIYYVQVDHLMRPARMTDQNANWVWDVIYSPFGATTYINPNPAVMDIRFPGQWFQLETGLAYNWHRHYDATTGRYVQPDPLIDDDGPTAFHGISTDATSQGGHYSYADALTPRFYSPRALMRDGPSLYDYVRQSPLVRSDPNGLQEDRRPFTPIPSPFIYSPRVEQNREPYHQFPYSFDAHIWTFGTFCGCGFPHGNTGVLYYQRCLEGALNGVRGTYELGIDMNFLIGEDVVIHRFFRPN